MDCFFQTLVPILTFLEKLVRKWSGFTFKSPYFTKNGTTIPWMLCKAQKVENFYKSPVKVWFYGIGPDLEAILVRICTGKWSGFGSILINLGPIWHLAALQMVWFLSDFLCKKVHKWSDLELKKSEFYQNEKK